MRYLGGAAAAVGFWEIKGTVELIRILPKSSEVQNFAAHLKHSRDKFGGEFLLAWNMHDRKAYDFAEYLREKKEASEKAPSLLEKDFQATFGVVNTPELPPFSRSDFYAK